MFGWCVAHRLELAVKDSLSGTAFDGVDELILHMYYYCTNVRRKNCENWQNFCPCMKNLVLLQKVGFVRKKHLERGGLPIR